MLFELGLSKINTRFAISLAKLVIANRWTPYAVYMSWNSLQLANPSCCAAPCGLFKTIQEVSDNALILDTITDDTDVRTVALISWYFHKTIQPKAKLIQFLDAVGPKRRSPTVRDAVLAIMRNNTKTGLISSCPDKNSAAIALSCSAPCHEIENDISQEIFESVEDRDDLLELDKQLLGSKCNSWIPFRRALNGYA